MAKVKTPLKVKFNVGRWGPGEPAIFNKLMDWTNNNNDKIKYYSGTAVYPNTFKVDKVVNGQRILLGLGNLTAMASVTINGAAAGGVWNGTLSVGYYRLHETRYKHYGYCRS